LIDLCADLAGDRERNGVIVFGSSYQRSTIGLDRESATRNFMKGWLASSAMPKNAA
jgi:hypothetical protein